MALSMKYLNEITAKHIMPHVLRKLWRLRFEALLKKAKKRKLDIIAFAVTRDSFEEIHREWNRFIDPLEGFRLLSINGKPIYPSGIAYDREILVILRGL
ncbi:hypothetical protein [Glutamicibacter sp.]|jgi:hypothetical protein|uniref:hypothetical protein n=1 Tax=Glutamicibacter sp. TaxID=1931995 RepID=UPI002FD8DFE1